jgi:Family of unknown function (DUF6064)
MSKIPFTTEQFLQVFQLSLLIIPVLWSIVGTSAALSFGVKEDFGLLVAATMGTAALAKPIGTIIVQHNLTLKTAQTL